MTVARVRACVAAAALLVVASPAALAAQRPLSVGVAGGVTVPQGELRDGARTGWHALVALALGGPMQPLGLRLDAAYHRLPLTDRTRAALGGDGARTLASATLNASYRLPMTDSPLSPYVITGLGAYRTACASDPGCASSIRYGWNAGVGTRLYVGGVTSFVEARYHRTSRAGAGVHVIPVTFGLLF